MATLVQEPYLLPYLVLDHSCAFVYFRLATIHFLKCAQVLFEQEDGFAGSDLFQLGVNAFELLEALQVLLDYLYLVSHQSEAPPVDVHQQEVLHLKRFRKLLFQQLTHYGIHD